MNAWSLLGRLLARAPPDEQVLELLAGADGAAMAGDNLLGAAWDMLAKAAARRLRPPSSRTSTRTCSSAWAAAN
jgi:hypothetical protein